MLSPLTPCSLNTLARELALLFSSLYVSFSFSKITAMLSGVFSTCSSNTRLIVFSLGYSHFVSLKPDSICFCSSSVIISILEISISGFFAMCSRIFSKCFARLSIVSLLKRSVQYSRLNLILSLISTASKVISNFETPFLNSKGINFSPLTSVSGIPIF
ncbi:MAG: hypothetical protein BWY74_02240 [Firmicutes bacterium ADurb.Bin419]|nr:MAG: hypothetical protein BWY74_02240 [Firmicutes bacterium ADurb.Bin419]